MHKKVVIYAIMLFAAPITTKTEVIDKSGLMALINSPVFFFKGCESIANSINKASESSENSSKQISSSLEHTSENIKKAGKTLQSAAQSIERAADKASHITHTWDPESKIIGSTFVRESAISILGLSVSLAGVYILYQSIYKIFLEDYKTINNNQIDEDLSYFQKTNPFLSKNSRSLAAGLIGVLFFCGGAKIIQSSFLLSSC